MIASNSPRASAGRPTRTYWRRSKAGTRSSVSDVTTPSAPTATTAPAKSASSRVSDSVEPSAVTRSIPDTAAARPGMDGPEPCVPVATEPATEMCGSEAMFASAKPASCSSGASRAYVMRAPTRTLAAAPSISARSGIRSSTTRSPVVSATWLKECPLPSARTRELAETSRWSSSSEVGWWTSRA